MVTTATGYTNCAKVTKIKRGQFRNVHIITM
jgi:hypothetical protein